MLEKWACALEKGHLGGIFLARPSTLIGEADDVLVLAVGELKYVNIAELGKFRLDLSSIGLELFLAVTETKIVGKLAHFKA